MDLIIDIFLQWFSESFAGVLFAKPFAYFDKKIKNKLLRYLFDAILIIISCLIAVVVAFGIVFLLIYLVITIFHI